MKTVTSIAKMQELARQFRRGGLTVGFVPTMGYLHEGHLELVRRARSMADVVVVSIFVNPTQFERDDDFCHYPRDEERDRRLLDAERVDVLFMPRAKDVYPAAASTRVRVAGLSEPLCGAGRPGHFEGVATVVAALLNMVGPDLAVFGEKDYQQLQVIRRMIADLHFPVRIIACPTVREQDGLAMSSRNARLDAEQRADAPRIYRALGLATDAFLSGQTETSKILATARHALAGCERIRVEYIEVVDGKTLEPVARADDGSVIAVAAWLGRVRLIDNIVFARALAEHNDRQIPSADRHNRGRDSVGLDGGRQGGTDCYGTGHGSREGDRVGHNGAGSDDMGRDRTSCDRTPVANASRDHTPVVDVSRDDPVPNTARLASNLDSRKGSS